MQNLRKHLTLLSDIFNHLTPDSEHNIQLITEYTVKILGGVCSLYNRLDNAKKSLITWADFCAPEDLQRQDAPDGHICYEATIKGKDKVVALEDLNQTPYVDTDPNVKKYKLRSYLGYPVRRGDEVIGSLCIVDTKPRKFSRLEIQIISILAKALSLEEDREFAHRELRDSEKSYREIFNLTNEAIFIHDKDTGKILDVNQAALDLYGYSKEEMLKCSVSDLSSGVAPYTQNDADNWIDKAVQEGPQSFDWVAKKKNGQLFWTNVQLKFAFIGGEERVLAVVKDIDVQKKAQIALAESEERYRILFNYAADYILVLDPFGPEGPTIIEANQAAWEKHGYTKEEFIGLPVKKIDNSVNAKQIKQRLQNLLTSKEQRFETVHIRKDGTVFPVEVSARIISLGGKPYIYAIERDITERKKAESALKESENLFRTILENSHAGIALIDDQTHFKYVNPVFAEITGYSREELVGESFLKVLAPESKDLVTKRYRQRQKGNKKIPTRYEFYILRKDGSRRLVELRSAVIDQFQGKKATVAQILDVTEQREAEQALKDSEHKYRQLVDHSLTGIYITQDEVIKYCNNRFAEIFGYQSSDELIGKNIEQIVEAESLPLVRKEINMRVTGQKLFSHFEIKGLRKDKQTIFIEVLGVRIEYQGKPAVQGTILDITERKIAEKKLIRNEQRYRQLFDFLPFGGELLNPEGFIIDCSLKSCQLFGYSREELLGKHFTELLAPTSLPFFKKNFPQLKSGLTISGEIIVQTKDGKELTLLRAGQPILNEYGQIEAVMSINVDITQQKKAQEEIKRLATVIEQSPEGILITDRNGTIEYINPAYERICGYSKDELIGRNPNILNSGEHDQAFFKQLWDTISAGKKWQGVIINKNKDGLKYFEENIILPIKNETGEITNYVSLKRDITLQRKLEEELQQAQKMEALGTLTGGIAHDFNNILTVINGHAEIALMRLRPEERVHGDLVSILNAGKRAERLTSQLLAFSRKQMHESRIMDLNETVQEMQKMIRRLIPEDIRIETLFAPELPKIKADPAQIEQIVINLVINARDALQGEVADKEKKITIKTESIVLKDQDIEQFPGLKSGHHVKLMVSDNGIGMTGEIKERIFEPFFTTKPVGKGTGLGLSTVYGIVKQNHAYIEVKSKVGQGTCFTIYWPATVEKSEDHFLSESDAENYSGDESILLVEDDPAVREFAFATLKNFGYDVHEAEDGLKAMELVQVKNKKFDLLITDIIMPGMNGRELSEKLKQMASIDRVLYVSGYSDDHLSKTGEIDARINFLQKPYSINKLLRKVRYLLDNKD